MILQPVAHDVPRGLTTLTKPIPRGTGEHVARLIRWFEATFDCREGLKCAWTHVPATTAEMQRIKDLEATEGAPGAWTADDHAFHADFFNRGRGVYQVLAFGCEGGPENEKRLCDALQKAVLDCLFDAATMDRTLYWRLGTKVQVEYVIGSDTVDFNTGRPGKTAPQARIYTRIAIPSLDLNRCAAAAPDGGFAPELPA